MCVTCILEDWSLDGLSFEGFAASLGWRVTGEESTDDWKDGF